MSTTATVRTSPAPVLSQDTPGQQLRLCLVVRTYSRQRRGFAALITSLLAAREGCGGNVSLTVDVFSTDDSVETGEQTRADVTALGWQPAFKSTGFELITHKQMTDAERQALYASACGSRRLLYDYGYLQSDAVLKRALTRTGSRECDYVMVTNGDNLYARPWLDFTCPYMHRRIGLIGWYFSSHNAGIGAWGHVAHKQGKVERTGENVLFRTRLRKTWMDLGAVMIRADLLRGQHGEYIFTDCGPWREADGRMIERLVQQRNISEVVLDRLLFFHQ